MYVFIEFTVQILNLIAILLLDIYVIKLIFRSYISTTGHWINPNNLERISILLAIKRLKGKHTYDVLAKAMESVYNEFDITNKITYSTTDNGSNFVKSFK